jgi:energy-coupling factor transporter ATP-binding protein EcfA2
LVQTLRNRPILGTSDAQLFVPPSGWDRLRRAIDAGLNVLIVGPSGSGKTSALRMLAQQPSTPSPVYIDLTRAATAVEALVVIADALGAPRPTALSTPMTSFSQPARQVPDSELLELVRSIGRAPAALLLVDDPPRGDEGHRLFGRLRDELWQLEHQWVVAASPGTAVALDRPPANAFFELRLELGGLDDEQQREMLRRRLPDQPGQTIEALIGRVDRPRELVALARNAILEGGSPTEAAAQIERINKRLADLSDLERAVVTFLRSHGGAFSSDPSLLAALEISQAQAAKVLKTLAGKGVLAPHPQRHGQGRPRTVYELAPEFQT